MSVCELVDLSFSRELHRIDFVAHTAGQILPHFRTDIVPPRAFPTPTADLIAPLGSRVPCSHKHCTFKISPGSGAIAAVNTQGEIVRNSMDSKEFHELQETHGGIVRSPRTPQTPMDRATSVTP